MWLTVGVGNQWSLMATDRVIMAATREHNGTRHGFVDDECCFHQVITAPELLVAGCCLLARVIGLVQAHFVGGVMLLMLGEMIFGVRCRWVLMCGLGLMCSGVVRVNGLSRG